MSLNIKNEEAHRLARELAESTGESRATAVTRAVREHLERVSQRRKKSKIQRILKNCEKVRAAVEEPFRSVDHADLLYDEKGLPK